MLAYLLSTRLHPSNRYSTVNNKKRLCFILYIYNCKTKKININNRRLLLHTIILFGSSIFSYVICRRLRIRHHKSMSYINLHSGLFYLYFGGYWYFFIFFLTIQIDPFILSISYPKLLQIN